MPLPRHHWIHRLLRVLVFALAIVVIGDFGTGSADRDPVHADVGIHLVDQDPSSPSDNPDLEEFMVGHAPAVTRPFVTRVGPVAAVSTLVDAPRAPPDRPPSLA